MARIDVTLHVRTRWWLGPATTIAVIGISTGLIKDRPSEEHVDGRITAAERAANWLIEHGMTITAR
ncbi:hypothetical protein [Novosphingobium sp. HII-3]|uniref:hypothetical protein n=1 Tax=Novosphingobium sp. HII-3 TaxID=2075565 RepID=UPI000CDA6125|nr:hypothetical protein [Novosphingobium sp. HII-3]